MQLVAHVLDLDAVFAIFVLLNLIDLDIDKLKFQAIFVFVSEQFETLAHVVIL